MRPAGSDEPSGDEPSGRSAADGAAGEVTLDSSPGRRVIATTVTGSAITMLTATVVGVALPAIASDLDAGSGAQQWVVTGYLLTMSSLLLVGGSLGDRLGRVRSYRIGAIAFAVASLMCAAAPTVGLLIAARVAQGGSRP